MELNLDWQRRRSALWPEVSYELRPLRVWAFQELAAFWEAAAPGTASEVSPDGDGERTPGRGASLAGTARLMDVARRILPEHVRALDGLHARSEGGTGPVAVADLSEETALLPLAAEIVARLVEISAPEPGGEKN